MSAVTCPFIQTAEPALAVGFYSHELPPSPRALCARHIRRGGEWRVRQFAAAGAGVTFVHWRFPLPAPCLLLIFHAACYTFPPTSPRLCYVKFRIIRMKTERADSQKKKGWREL